MNKIKNKSYFIVKWLIVANIVLFAISWLMTIVAYPKLPPKIPPHFNLKGAPDTWKNKSLLVFLIYPIIQTIFVTVFFLIALFSKNLSLFKKEILSLLSKEKKKVIYSLLQEFIFLVLIFFNLIFIHLQRSIILASHQLAEGIDKSYFYSIIGIILMLVFLYFLRIKLKLKEFLTI